MGWQLRVYNPANDALQGTLSEAYGVSWVDRLGTIGVLSFGVDRESTSDIALLDYRRVVRVYEDDQAVEPFAAGFVDDDPAELATPDELPRVSYTCPSLDAWLGTSDLGGAVVYPFGGLSGRQQDPRRFGPEALEFDDTAWSSPTLDGSTPGSFAGGEPSWFVSTNRSLFRLVIPASAGSFPGRMLLRASRRLNVEVYLDADRVLSKSDGQTGVTQFDVDYDGSEDRVVLIDVAGSGKVGWAWGEVVEDEDDDSGVLGDVHFKSDSSWKQLDDYTTYPGMTPGYIAKTLVEEAQARGALSGLSIDFDEDEDSDGVPWSGTVAHAFSVGSKLGWVLEQITQFGYDWRVNPDGVLQIFELLGEDRSGTVDLDVLEEHKAAGEGVKATALLWLSAGSMSDTDVSSAVGRIEEAATFGTSASAVKLEAVAANLLDDLSIPRDTSTLSLSQDSPQPYEDFWLGDVVAYTDRDGPSTGRVTEIVGTQDDADGTVSWSVTVDFETGQYSRERERRIRDQLREAFSQTVGGRALLAAPRPSPGEGGGVTVPDGVGGRADPRTITVEAEFVDIEPGGTLIPWQRLTSPYHLVRFTEPIYPDPEVRIESDAVWQPRVELEWDPLELAPTVTPHSIEYPFRGGGEVTLKVNGLWAWPLGDGITAPSPAAPGIHRTFQQNLPPLRLIENDRVELEIEHDDTETRRLARALLSLTLIEPFEGALGGDPDAPGPVDELNGDPDAEFCGNGPNLWVRFRGEGTEPLNMLDDYRDAEGALCAQGASGGAEGTDPNGPYGDASMVLENPDGTFSNSGTFQYQTDASPGVRSFILRFRIASRPDGSPGGGGWLVAPLGSAGAASGESRAFGVTGSAAGNPGVSVRVNQINHPVGIAPGPNWHMIGATLLGDASVDPRLIVIWNGVVVHDVMLDPFNFSNPGTWRFFRGIDTFGTASGAARYAGLAEVITWPTARRLDQAQLLAAMVKLAAEGKVD